RAAQADLEAIMQRILPGIVAAMLAAALATGAVAQSKTYTVMLILFRGQTPAEQGFMDQLKQRVPVEFIIRNVDGDRSKMKDFVDEAKRTRPDLIYTFGTTVTLDTVGGLGQFDASRHIGDIPVVFNIVADPVGARLATGFTTTGRNLTGVSHLVPMADQLRAM